MKGRTTDSVGRAVHQRHTKVYDQLDRRFRVTSRHTFVRTFVCSFVRTFSRGFARAFARASLYQTCARGHVITFRDRQKRSCVCAGWDWTLGSVQRGGLYDSLSFAEAQVEADDTGDPVLDASSCTPTSVRVRQAVDTVRSDRDNNVTVVHFIPIEWQTTTTTTTTRTNFRVCRLFRSSCSLTTTTSSAFRIVCTHPLRSPQLTHAN